MSANRLGFLTAGLSLLAGAHSFLQLHQPTSSLIALAFVGLAAYPRRALREALVNAVAHRNYEDASRKIGVQVFSDRIVVASPGYPPSPLTLTGLRRGNYRPGSRNSVIAQALATMNLMEQRGSGFARMRDAMLDHGLDAPSCAQQDGYFAAALQGPNGNYERLKLPQGVAGFITPADDSSRHTLGPLRYGKTRNLPSDNATPAAPLPGPFAELDSPWG